MLLKEKASYAVLYICLNHGFICNVWINPLNKFIRIEYHINPKILVDLPKIRIFTYCDSFGSYREPSSDCDLDLLMARDLDCLPLDCSLLMVNKNHVDIALVVRPLVPVQDVWTPTDPALLAFFIAGRYRPVNYPDGPITARYRFIKNAYWVNSFFWLVGVWLFSLSTTFAPSQSIAWLAFAIWYMSALLLKNVSDDFRSDSMYTCFWHLPNVYSVSCWTFCPFPLF